MDVHVGSCTSSLGNVVETYLLLHVSRCRLCVRESSLAYETPMCSKVLIGI